MTNAPRRSRLCTRFGERNHILLIVAVSCLTGCYFSYWLASGAWLWALLPLGVGLGVSLRRLGARAGLAIALCAFTLGAMRTHAALNVARPTPGSYAIAGTVCGEVTRRDNGRSTFALANVTLDGVPTAGKAYCTVYGMPEGALFDGASLRVDGRVYLPDGKRGAVHMDFNEWMLRKGMRFCISTSGEPEVLNTPDDAPPCDYAHRARQGIIRALARVMGERSRVAAALLLGDRDGLSAEEREAFSALGIAHLMSVSGLHISLLGGALYLLLKRLRAGERTRLVVCAAFLLAYCWVTGFTAACVRAAVMFLLYGLARLCRRAADPLTVLAAAMLCVLGMQPLYATSVGFILSFGATLSIQLFAPPIRRGLEHLWATGQPIGFSRPRRALRRLYELLLPAVSVSAAAQLGVLLPTALFFHQIPLYGVFINLLIVPLAGSLLTPLCALALILSPVPMLGSAVGWTAGLLADAVMELVRWLSALPCASLRVASPAVILCVGVGVAAVCLCRRVSGSLLRRGIAAVLAVAIGACGAWAARPPELRYIQLSVGWGDCALLLDGDATVMIDAARDGQNALDYLLAEGRDVDALFLTHLHTDHIGGVNDLLDAGVRIGRVYLPQGAERQRIDPLATALLERLRALDIPIQHLARGDELRYNEAVLRVLFPEAGKARANHDANDRPLVLAVDLGGYTVLSVSDLNGAYEPYVAAPADVLKAAHHGSKYASGEAFLSSVQPRVALISCPAANPRLPSPDTLARLEQQGVSILRTDVCGDITITVRNGKLVVSPYLTREAP